MESAPRPPSGRRPISIRAQLGWVTGLVLLLTLTVALSSYVSLRQLQAGVQTTVAEAERIRGLSLDAANQFLLARESEAGFFSSWRSLGFQAASVRYVGSSSAYLLRARALLDELEQTAAASADPALQGLVDQVAALRPLLDDYETAFQGAVRLTGDLGRASGVENQLRDRLAALEATVAPLPNPQFLRLVLEMRIVEQAYLTTAAPEYADQARLLANEFAVLVENSPPEDLTPPGGAPLPAADLIGQAEEYRTLFDTLVSLEQQIEVQSTIFREVTDDIQRTTDRIARASQTGVARAQLRLERIVRQATLTLLVTSVLAVGLGALATVLLARRISDPLDRLSQAAEAMGRGEWARPVAVRGGAELVTLASAFNGMAAQLRQMLTGLEQQVAERTQALQRRAVQLQTAAEVARDATAAGELGDLLDRAVALIRDRFGFYHAGLFLLDDEGEYAVLRAASSEGGRRMLARGHRLKVGEAGIVGWSAGFGQPRIALDVGEDAVFFDNLDLPETRSELALPLKVRERVIGVLDVQSVEPAAFTEEDVAILQVMADQLAVAIENARLFQEMQMTIRDAEAAYGRYTQEAWREVTRAGRLAYRYRGTGVEPVGEPPEEVQRVWLEGQPVSLPATTDAGEAQAALSSLAVPVKLRGQVVGVLNLRFRSESVSPETISLVEQVAERLALALESARLLRETRALAGRERTIRQITEDMRRVVDVEAILQTAISQLGNVIGAPRVYVRLGTEEGLGPGGGNGSGAAAEENRHA